jgi:lipopolysaccharide transport system ATP-binding protein
MKGREWQIGLFGTFDVENYGDLLFPLLAERELSERLGPINLHRFSYHSQTPPGWPYAVTSVTELPQMVSRLDGLLIGGGFIIRFDKDVAPGYEPPTSAIHHPTGYWLTPALIALQHDVPLVWNAPGLHCNEIPAWADPLMKPAFSLSRYIAVRDAPSQAVLAPFACGQSITVVPDTGFGISRLLTDRPSSEFSRLRAAAGLTDPYIIIQAALGLEAFLSFVKRYAHRLKGYRFLALPIGPTLGDHATILDADLPGLVRLPTWPPPLLLAELISQAAAVVGHSYHLAITALAAGVPVFTAVDLSVGKYSALLDFETIYPMPKGDEPDAERFVARLGKTPPSAAARTALDALAMHWDQVASAIGQGSTTTQTVLNQFWQSLPELLETGTMPDEKNAGLQRRIGQSRAARAGPGAARPETKRRIDELNKLLALARAEIVARDERIAALYNSPSWKVTAPLRFIRRTLKRLLGKRGAT